MIDLVSNLQLQTTADGSYTLLRTDLGETYHSRNGALQEGRHVFIENGLALLPKNIHLNILEIGLGTHLNAYLALEYATLNNVNITYCGLEKYPVPKNLMLKSKLNWDETGVYFEKLIHSNWEAINSISPFFKIQKLETDILLYNLLPTNYFHCVFMDAFAPNYEPHMWTLEIFNKLFDSLTKNGILTTYCAKSVVRKNMIAAGFDVKKVKGPPGKREMIIAYKL